MTERAVSPSARRSPATVHHLLVLSLALVAVVLLGVAVLLAEGTRRLDELKIREDRFLIANLVSRIGTNLLSDVTAVAIWDQAYRNLRPGGDVAWADDNVGTYFADNRGFDRTVAIDGQNRPFYAWVGKHRVDPAGQAAFAADAAPLIGQLRALEAVRGVYADEVDPTDPAVAESAKGILVSGGQRYLIGASIVTPSDLKAPRRPGRAMILITAQLLDSRILHSLRGMRVNTPRVVAASRSAASVPLTDVRGWPVGAIAWTPQNAGLEVVREDLPGLGLGLALFAAVMAGLGWKMRNVVRDLRL